MDRPYQLMNGFLGWLAAFSLLKFMQKTSIDFVVTHRGRTACLSCGINANKCYGALRKEAIERYLGNDCPMRLPVTLFVGVSSIEPA
jgi:hypothetical protein